MTRYFQRFFDEKDLPYVMFEIELDDEVHLIDNETIIDLIKGAPSNEQTHIANTLRRLDFVNASINDYLRHLAEGFVKTQQAA